jgi:hypothetical protein
VGFRIVRPLFTWRTWVRHRLRDDWQSEFLSTAVIVVLSIFLRFKGSREFKPVAVPHSETGD